VTAREVIQDHYSDRRRLSRSVAQEGRRLWRQVNPDDLDSWMGVLTRLLLVLTGAQRAAAGSADSYIRELLDGRAEAEAEGAVLPQGFSGVASDGRPLDTLLQSPVVATKMAISRGVGTFRAMATGEATLEMTLRTQIADAGRVADGVAMVTLPEIAGYERVVHLPACGRCIILAGRLYRWSTGFARHPQCDCTMEPVTSDEWRNERPENEPKRLFERMTPEDQEKAFTKKGAQAIQDGADPSQVVNARRGMTTAGTTREGITRRGIAGARLITGDPTAFTAPRTGGNTVEVSQFRRETTAGTRTVRLRGARQQRLMPEEIYKLADNRAEAVELLRLHGFIL
jgi:hypothetical protein